MLRRVWLVALLAGCGARSGGGSLPDDLGTSHANVKPPKAVTGGPEMAHVQHVDAKGNPIKVAPATQESKAPAAVAADTPAGDDAARDTELAAAAAPIVDAYQNAVGTLSPDGKRVVFMSNRDGVWQIYVSDVAKPAAAPVRLVTQTDRAQFPQFTPDGKRVIYVSDHDADENYSIWAVDADGKSAPALLTPGEKVRRDPPAIPDQAPETMYYTQRAAEDVGVRIVRQKTAGGTPELAYLDEKPGGLLDVSRDGKQALLAEIVSDSDTIVERVDLAAGKATRLYPAEDAKALASAAAFSADGKTIFVSTDEGKESAVVLALDAASGKEKARYVETRPATATIDQIVVAKDGRTLALHVNAGNQSELRLLDARTLKPTRAKISLPLGSGGPFGFSDDGKKLLVGWSTPETPADLYVIDVATGKSTPARKDVRASLASLGKLEVSIAKVAASDGLDIPVNVYLPALARGARARKQLPVMVIVHGGPADSSAIGWNQWARWFTSRGYAVVEPNVRGSAGFGRAYEEADNGPKRLDAVDDLGAVARWIKQQPWADAQRLVVLGGSYGGYMTLMALTHQPELWRAGVDLAGPANLRTFMQTTTGEIRAVFAVEFGDPDVPEQAQQLDNFSAIALVDKIAAPLFVYQGENDPRVPRGEADQIVAALRARKVPVEYMLVTDEGHSLDHRENKLAFYARTARFLEKILE